MAERLIEKKKSYFYATLTIKRLDKVNHIALSKLIVEYNMPNKDIRLIGTIYHDQEAQIKINTSLSRKVTIKQGVRKGRILSLIIFTMYSKGVINSTLKKRQRHNYQ